MAKDKKSKLQEEKLSKSINLSHTDKHTAERQKAELKAKIESILFCIPEGVTIDVLANKLNLGLKNDIKKILEELQQDYALREGGIKLIQDGNLWKFSIPDEHTELIKEAATPEFDTSVLETLAYIAWRGGSRQCDVVRVRSNKAYNHIKLLKEKGFIESHKSGLSKWLQLTKKFYDYFKINPGEKLPLPEEVEKRLEEAEKARREEEKETKYAKQHDAESHAAESDTNHQ